jgi:hypothetical protein
MNFMRHVVLLGDSIFDNARYTAGGPDVITHLREALPQDSRATLLAVDGATADEVLAQLKRMPSDATHLVLSAGGNNALMNSNILHSPADSSSQVLRELADISREFETEYRRTIQACLQQQLPLSICTIYNGCFHDEHLQKSISSALMVFNDVILRIGIEFQLTIIDLRHVCSAPADYANSIEPSCRGGEKIAQVISKWISGVGAPRAGAQILIG